MTTETITIIDAFNMYQAQYSQVDKLWNYFGVISIAVAGFTVGSEKASRTIWEPIVIVVGYLAFCLGNYQALKYGHEFLVTLTNKYNDLAAPQDFGGLTTIPMSDITFFYSLVVITFTSAIILVSMSRLKSHHN